MNNLKEYEYDSKMVILDIYHMRVLQTIFPILIKKEIFDFSKKSENDKICCKCKKIVCQYDRIECSKCCKNSHKNCCSWTIRDDQILCTSCIVIETNVTINLRYQSSLMFPNDIVNNYYQDDINIPYRLLDDYELNRIQRRRNRRINLSRNLLRYTRRGMRRLNNTIMRFRRVYVDESDSGDSGDSDDEYYWGMLM